MGHTIFSVDIGTSSLKAALIDTTGVVLHETRHHFPKSKRLLDHWYSSFLMAYTSAKEAIRDQKKMIDAIVISGNGPSVVSLNKAGKFSPILLWNDPEAQSVFGESLFISRILTLKERAISQKDMPQTIFSGPEALIYRLTGNAVTILPEQRYAPMYWSENSLEKAGIQSALLPKFVPPGAITGFYDTHIPVIAGGPDFFVALIGTGTLFPGTACDRAGTSEGLNVCTTKRIVHPSIRTLPAVKDPFWNASFLLPTSGTAFHEWRTAQGLGKKSYPDILSEIERSPIFSLNAEHPGRTIVEHIGFSLRQGIEILNTETQTAPAFRVSGGQARNPVWIQMKADITGSIFEETTLADAELMGNAILGAVALGDWNTLEDAVSAMVCVRTTYTPRSALFRQYTEKYELWRKNQHVTPV